MKKRISISLTKMFTIFVLLTVILVCISVLNIKNNTFTHIFVGCYALFIFLLLFCIFARIIYNLTKLKWFEVRKVIIKFVVILIIGGFANYLFHYFFRTSKLDLLESFYYSLGPSLGISLCDLVVTKKY